jgi:hypothetical protein
LAGWAGAHAVQSQLVSLANPGLGYSVHLRKDQSLVVGACLFDDQGNKSRYNWIAFERSKGSVRQWVAYTIIPGDGSELQLISLISLMNEDRGALSRLGDTRVPLGKRLMSLWSDLKRILSISLGKNLITVIDVNNVLHFRVFDGDGKTVVQTDEKKLEARHVSAPNLNEMTRQLDQIKRQLKALWPPHNLTAIEKRKIIALVRAIIGPDGYDRPSPQKGDLVKDASIDWFTDQRVGLSLGPEAHHLGWYSPGGTLLHDHDLWDEVRWGSNAYNPESQLWPTVRAVVSGDIITFSIEVRNADASGGNGKVALSPSSFHLAGEYRHVTYFPAPAEKGLQFGAVVLRNLGRPEPSLLDRAAAYGSDVLRRRAESLWELSSMRTERVSNERHLILFARNARSGETSWLAISGDAANPSQVSSKIRGQTLAIAEGWGILPPCPDSPWLVPGPRSAVPAESYPMYLGGSDGYRFVEVMLVRKPVTFGPSSSFAQALYDVSYLLIPPR